MPWYKVEQAQREQDNMSEVVKYSSPGSLLIIVVTR